MTHLFTTVFGSKLHGTDTPESDTDLKSIFLPELKPLLRGVRVKNTVNTTGDKAGKNTSSDEDHEYIPLQVFAQDFVKGQTYAVEMAFVIGRFENEHTEMNEEFKDMLLQFVDELTGAFLTSNISSMMGYALGQASKYGIKGTRLNAMRDFHAVVEKHALESLVGTKLRDNDEFLSEVEKTSGKYMFLTTYEGPKTNQGEQAIDPAISILEKIMPLDITFTDALSRTSAMVKKFGHRAEKAAEFNGHDWKAIAHALRITMQAHDVLTTGELSFPFEGDRLEYIRDTKQGLKEWDEVSQTLKVWLDAIDEAKDVTELPHCDDEFTTRFNSWLDEWLLRLYGIESHD